MTRILARLVLLAATAVLPFHAADAQQPSRARVGTLDCDISAGIGFIVGSQKSVQCMFVPDDRSLPEYYSGTIGKLGVDIGVTTGGRMVWAVVADTTRARGALAGTYGGVSAQATAGVGVGANVLVGGSNRTVSLQPLSVEGQAGLNVAGGVTQLTLQYMR